MRAVMTVRAGRKEQLELVVAQRVVVPRPARPRPSDRPTTWHGGTRTRSTGSTSPSGFRASPSPAPSPRTKERERDEGRNVRIGGDSEPAHVTHVGGLAPFCASERGVQVRAEYGLGVGEPSDVRDGHAHVHHETRVPTGEAEVFV